MYIHVYTRCTCTLYLLKVVLVFFMVHQNTVLLKKKKKNSDYVRASCSFVDANIHSSSALCLFTTYARTSNGLYQKLESILFIMRYAELLNEVW